MFCSFDTLEHTIQEGDLYRSQCYAVELAKRAQHPTRQSAEENVRIQVRVADKCNIGPAKTHIISKSYTVSDLKMMMLVTYNFALDKQIWIVNGKPLGDTDPVYGADCHHSLSEPEVCVYLKDGRISQPVDDDNELWRIVFHQRALVVPATTDAHRQAAGTSLAPANLGYTLDEISMSPSISSLPGLHTGVTSESSGYSSASSAIEGDFQGELLSNVSAIQVTTQLNNDIDYNDAADQRSIGQSSGRTITALPVIYTTDSQPTYRAEAWYADTEAAVAEPELQQSHGEQESLAIEPQVQLSVWSCPECTYDNRIERPGCEMCGTARPDELYVDPQIYVPSRQSEQEPGESEPQLQELDRLLAAGHLSDSHAEQLIDRYRQMASVEQSEGLVSNSAPFQCPICLSDIEAGEGVVLRQCLHEFCRSCLEEHMSYSTEPEIICPYMDDTYSCSAPIPDREVKALTPERLYEKYLQRSLAVAEAQERNSFHCQTPNCAGWCVYDDNVNFFPCPVCRHSNCLTCKAIHEGMDCKQYQDDLKVRGAANDAAALQTQKWLEKLIERKRAMRCPGCQIVLQKKDGCDWIKCSVCKMEVCWVRKMPRWGPKGLGDTTGGCQCNHNGKKCDRRCRNCH